LLSSPYYSFLKVESEDSSVFYQFITQNNIAYTVYFSIDQYEQYVDQYPVLLQKGYAFGFRRQKFDSTQKNIYDDRVNVSIYHIISDFIKDKGDETILLYHCDVSDGKQSYRNRLFNAWEKIFVDSHLIKHSIEVQIDTNDNESTFHYLGFITLSRNPLLEEVKKEFDEFSIYLVQPKD
jgi:hypothetical protein